MSDLIRTSGKLRPTIKDTDLEVHRVANRIWNKGENPDIVLNDYYVRNGVPEILDYENPKDMEDDNPYIDLPETVYRSDIITALEFARSNYELISSIIKEDRKLRSLLFDQNTFKDKDELKRVIGENEFKYYNIDFDVNENGYSIDWGENADY